MPLQNHYPASPAGVPKDLTQAKSTYKRQVWIAMCGLLAFLLFYLSLTACFAFIAYSNFVKSGTDQNVIFHMTVAIISSLLTVFMVKSLFTVRRSAYPTGVEVNASDEPVLFDFLNKLADEVGAPKPHRVFITAEVNAAVFYDLSLLNLIFPSKKNLIVGLGLVNVLNLGELKAVLAHEFGHFAQGAMAVGRWVYVAQQIISHMVATRDWLDSIVSVLSRISIRFAWIGWILALVIWSIRSLMDTLFRIVILAERALSREMEFNADLVSVSVTGSDALINALHKLQAADEAWRTTLDVANQEASNGKRINDLFDAQKQAIESIGQILNDETYGATPHYAGVSPSKHRVFSEQEVLPPQMWSTHPANRDREDNAKSIYVSANIDNRSSWEVFSNAENLRKQVSMAVYNQEKATELLSVSGSEAIKQRFDRPSYSPQYRGTYLSRSPVRGFRTVAEILGQGGEFEETETTLDELYPESIGEMLELARSLDSERQTLQALESGDLKPSGGVIRHRGEEITKSEIPEAIEQVASERTQISKKLKVHDSECRKAHLKAARNIGLGWEEYLTSLVSLLHCVEHLQVVINNEQALLTNTWQVITADGKIGFFEKRRMLKVCENAQKKMREVSSFSAQVVLPSSIAEASGIQDWSEQSPKFEISSVDKNNWGEWCPAASQLMANLAYALGVVRAATLEELINSEALIASCLRNGNVPDMAASPGACPTGYPVLLPGEEYVLQRKLDLWNRFQLAHGLVPTVLRLLVAVGIVGGTIYSGLL